MIHHTRGVYPNGDYKDNGVSSENLGEHIYFNIRCRPGRALFLDGFCIYEGCGGVSEELIVKHMEMLEGVTADKDTAPYQ